VVDLAARLGTIGHVLALRRLAVTPYAASPMRELAELEALAAEGRDRLDATLLPPDGALCAWPAIELGTEAAARLRQGQWLPIDSARALGRVRVYGEDGTFLGVGEVLATGELRPRRLFVGRTLGAE